MPIYEYRCRDCGHELEALQKISDPKLTTCPECGQEALTKLVSASAFVLKGSGWYVTDFKDKPKAAKGDGKDEAKKSGESAQADSGEGKSEKSGEKSEASGDKAADKSQKKSDSYSGKSDSKPQKKAAGD